ncbi:MAG: DMT family transporter, partial [Pseudomonadota bacterium]
MAQQDRPADNVNLSILLICGFSFMVPIADAATKIASETVNVPQITLMRFITQSVILGAFFGVFARKSLIWPRPIAPLIWRGGFLAMATAFLYASLAVMPLIEATAILFVQPLIITALSAALLGETVGWRRALAVLVGLTGAMIIIGPNLNELGYGAILPLLSATCFAAVALSTRRWANIASLPMMLLVTALSAMVFMAVLITIAGLIGVGAVVLVMPDSRALWLILFVGCLSTVTTMMITQAFRIAPASVAAPFMYVEVV